MYIYIYVGRGRVAEREVLRQKHGGVSGGTIRLIRRGYSSGSPDIYINVNIHINKKIYVETSGQPPSFWDCSPPSASRRGAAPR